MLRRSAAAASLWLLLGCEDKAYVIGRFVDPGCASQWEGPSEMQPEELFCSGFERPDLSDWDQRVVIQSAQVEQTEQRARSGRGALHATSTNHESAGAVAVEFPAVFEGDLFLRVHMYVPDGLETKTTNVLFLGDQPAPDPFKGIDFNFEAGAPEVFVPENEPVRFTSTTLVIPRERWFCYQVQINVSEDAGAITLRVDGEMALEATDVDTLPEAGIHLLRAGIDWSSKQTTPFAIFMDDLALSTRPIECN